MPEDTQGNEDLVQLLKDVQKMIMNIRDRIEIIEPCSATPIGGSPIGDKCMSPDRILAGLVDLKQLLVKTIEDFKTRHNL